ncbi:MAG TPA: hypothetical protein VF188_01610 [Longimicrobiales bacterium]
MRKFRKHGRASARAPDLLDYDAAMVHDAFHAVGSTQMRPAHAAPDLPGGPTGSYGRAVTPGRRAAEQGVG